MLTYVRVIGVLWICGLRRDGEVSGLLKELQSWRSGFQKVRGFILQVSEEGRECKGASPTCRNGLRCKVNYMKIETRY